MEMMGLAVIVILLALGMFFILRFTILQDPSIATQTFQQRQIASTFVSTLLSSNAGCSGSTTFAKLIEDIPDEQLSLLNCGNGELLSTYYQNEVDYILNQTLSTWGYAYNLTVLFPSSANKDPISVSQNCPTLQEETKIFPILSDYGTIRVLMKICY